MKIALINPKSDFTGLASAGYCPNLGLASIGTILKSEGHYVKIYDETIKPVNVDKIDADIVGISIMTPTARRGYEISKALKERPKIFIGGPHASACPKEAKRHCDTVIVGEADEVISDVVSNKLKGSIIKGEQVTSMDALPFPDFSLIEGFKGDIYSISTSRGCPFSCSFCSVSKVWGTKYRFRSPENVVKELELQKMERMKYLLIYDDNFAANKERSKKILEMMIERDIILPWVAQVRSDVYKDEELLKLMSESGCDFLDIGFESVSDRTLGFYNKRQTVEDIKNCIKKLHDYGIKIYGMFVLGADTDELSTVKSTLDFVNTNEIDTVQFSILTPLPGTDLFHKLNKSKRIFNPDWKYYDTTHVVHYPRNMKPYDLQAEFMEAWKEFYNNRHLIKNIMRRKWSVAALNIIARRLTKKAIKEGEEYLEYLEKV